METSYGFRTVGDGEKQALVDEVFHRVAEPLRPDERPDVGRPAPRSGRTRMVAWLNPPRRAGLDRCSTWPAAPATSPSASSRPRGGQAPGHRARHQRLDARRRPERAEKRGLDGQHRLRRGQCRGPALRRRDASTPTRSPSASATCRASTWRSREAYPRAEARRALPVPGILRGRHAAARQGSTRPGRSRPFPRIGKMVAGDGEPYAYLVESIRNFPNQAEFRRA